MVIYLAHPISNADATTIRRIEDIRVELARVLPFVLILDPSTYGLRDDVDWKSIVIKNKMDILRSEVVIADLMKPSIGTSMECLFAKMNNKPLIILTDSKSAWITEVASSVETTISGVAQTVKHIMS